MSTSSTPIRVDTKEVGHIYVLFPTLEHSVPMGSPAAPGMTLCLFYFVQFGFPSPTPNLHETNTTYTCIFVKHASFIDYVNIIHPIN